MSNALKAAYQNHLKKSLGKPSDSIILLHKYAYPHVDHWVKDQLNSVRQNGLKYLA
jgi:hypothetical protein